MKVYDVHGRKIPYGVQPASPERNKLATNYLRQNPHRLQLGNLGFDLTKKDGLPVQLSDIKDVHQTLDMWTGELKSHFTIEGTASVLGLPEQTVDVLLMPVQKNTYLVNGHNYQDKRLRLYLPGNGGVLSAVALMCTEGCFPKTWKVKWEGLKRML